ncbi:MAG: heterodisulfide reductase-related iron-sulfur binding cluster [Candidatus Hermodarchaeota archaeon]
MFSLKFDEKACLTCPTFDCLVKCQYMDIDKDTAKIEMGKMIKGEESFVLHQCVTCYACEEYCKRGNHPFYLITDLQEKKGIFPMPKPLTTQWVNIGIPTRKDIPHFFCEEPAISLCLFPAFIKPINEEKLFDDLSIIIGRHFFCQLVYLHFAKPSLIRERLPGIIENIANHDFNEVIFFHDECYSTFTSYTSAYGIDVPFKPIHFFEYLYNKLRDRQNDITPLNVKVAYQRNCSSRLTPKMEHFVDDIFGLIGAERVERKYDRENALCCAGIIRGLQRYDLFVDVQKRNIEDMANAEVEYCVFNCPACFDSLSEAVTNKGIKPIMMHELCLLALSEKTVER